VLASSAGAIIAVAGGVLALPMLGGVRPRESSLLAPPSRTFVWLETAWLDQTVTTVDPTVTIPSTGFEIRYWIDGRRFRSPDRINELPNQEPPAWVSAALQGMENPGEFDIVAVGVPLRCAYYLRTDQGPKKGWLTGMVGSPMTASSKLPTMMWGRTLANTALWMMVIAPLLLAPSLARRAFRMARRTCPKCGYPRSQTHTCCPECGSSDGRPAPTRTQAIQRKVNQ